jgi:hypothetical protein
MTFLSRTRLSELSHAFVPSGHGKKIPFKVEVGTVEHNARHVDAGTGK